MLTISCNLLNILLKGKTGWLYGCRMVASVSVFTLFCVVDWELWLTATAQHHRRVLEHVSLAWERMEFQNLKYNFYWMHTVFTPLWSQKIISQTIVSHRSSIFITWSSPWGYNKKSKLPVGVKDKKENKYAF